MNRVKPAKAPDRARNVTAQLRELLLTEHLQATVHHHRILGVEPPDEVAAISHGVEDRTGGLFPLDPVDGGFGVAPRQQRIARPAGVPAPRQGLHIAVPQYVGGHIYWIYANGRIVGRHTVDALNSFRFHKTDSGTYVHSTDGELLLKLSVDDRLPIYYPKGKGLFQEDLPTLAYEDPGLYELIEVPLAPGQYQIDILDIYTPLRSNTLNPLCVSDQTTLEIETGQFSFHATSLSYRGVQEAVRLRNNDPAWPEKEMNRIQLQYRNDHMRQVLDNAEDMTGDFFMDMTEVGLGTREFDAEQILHMRKWLRQKYESSLAPIESQ